MAKTMSMCPFCRRECYLEGTTIFCTHCDAEYEIEKKGPVLKVDGVVTNLKEDVERIKVKLGMVEGATVDDIKTLEPEKDLTPPADESDPDYWNTI